jgi:hypothetical protein
LPRTSNLDTSEDEYVNSVATTGDKSVWEALVREFLVRSEFRPATNSAESLVRQYGRHSDAGVDAMSYNEDTHAWTIWQAKYVNSATLRGLKPQDDALLGQAWKLLIQADPAQAVSLAQGIAGDPQSATTLDQAADALREAGAGRLKNAVGVVIYILLILVALGVAWQTPEMSADDQVRLGVGVGTVALAIVLGDKVMERRDNDSDH